LPLLEWKNRKKTPKGKKKKNRRIFSTAVEGESGHRREFRSLWKKVGDAIQERGEGGSLIGQKLSKEKKKGGRGLLAKRKRKALR